MLRRPWLREVAARLGYLDTYVLPPAVLDRSPVGLSDEQGAHLTAATRQWLRVLARDPRRPPAAPVQGGGRGVGRAVRPPGRAHRARGPGVRARAPRRPARRAAPCSAGAVALHRTYLAACADEGVQPPHLPLLLRVDWLLDRLDAPTYVPNCGERRYCLSPEDTVCLQHLVARPVGRRTTWRGPDAGTSFSHTRPSI